MRRARTLATVALGSAVLLPFVGAGTAMAADGDVMANLKPVALNGVDASGTAMVEVRGTTINVTMAAMGLLADAPHAAHIHFAAAARHECPTAGDDTNKDGQLNTTEGGPAYGDIVVSLTKTGDTSPKSGLAVDRFDTAQGGKISYQRGSIQVSSGVADAIAKGQSVVVIHGVDHNHDGKYDGDTKSDLDPSLPTEATDPAVCGALARRAGRRRGHRCRRRLEPDQHRPDRPRRWPAARGRRLRHPDGASRPRPELMDQPAQHGGRRGVVLAAAATVVLVLLAGVLLDPRAALLGSAAAPGRGRGAGIPAPRSRRDRRAATGEPGAVGPLAAPTPAPAAPSPRARPVDLGPILPGSPPVRLDIPSIGVHTSTFVDLGRGRDGSIEVPQDFAAAGFYTPARPRGSSDPAVIAGHVDSTRGPAVFYRLGALKAGATVSVGRRDGTTAQVRRGQGRGLPEGAVPHRRGLRQHHQPGRAAADHLRRVVRRPQRALRRQRGGVRPPGLRHLTRCPCAPTRGVHTARRGGNAKGPRPADSAQRVGGPGALVVRRTATGALGPWPPQGQGPWCGAVWRQATVAVGAGATPACPSSWRTSVSR